MYTRILAILLFIQTFPMPRKTRSRSQCWRVNRIVNYRGLKLLIQYGQAWGHRVQGIHPDLTSFYSDIDKAARLEVITSGASYLNGRDLVSDPNGFFYVLGKTAAAFSDLCENPVNFSPVREAGLLAFC